MSKEKRYYFDECSVDIYDGKIDDYPDTRTICETLNRQDQKIADLEEKLAEKEKENDNLQDKLHHYYEETLNNGTCGVCKYLRNEYKTDFAIEQLEKVKEFANNEKSYDFMTEIVYLDELLKQIDQQIKELKEGK